MSAAEYNELWSELSASALAIGGTVAVLLCVVLGMAFVKAVTE